MCAVEIEIGAGFPTPEKFLFQHVMSKPNAQRTMLGAKRWAAEDSLAADLIEEACPQDELFDRALAFAEEQSRLARGPHGRKLYMSVKNQMKGHGGLPAPSSFRPPPTSFGDLKAVAASVHSDEELHELRLPRR